MMLHAAIIGQPSTRKKCIQIIISPVFAAFMDSTSMLAKGKPLKIVSFLKKFEHSAVDQRKFEIGTNSMSQMKRVLASESEGANDGEPSEKKDKIEVRSNHILYKLLRLQLYCSFKNSSLGFGSLQSLSKSLKVCLLISVLNYFRVIMRTPVSRQHQLQKNLPKTVPLRSTSCFFKVLTHYWIKLKCRMSWCNVV